MKKNKLLLPILFSIFLFVLACNPSSDKKEPAKEEPAKDPEPTAEEKKKRGEELMKIIGAGEEHDVLTSIAGQWNYKTTVKSAGDTTTMFIGEGITSNKSILEKRFLLSESQRKSKDPMAVGLAVIGYDRGLKKYTVSLYSEGGTYYVESMGEMDKKTNTIKTSGEYFNPVLKVSEAYDIDIVFQNKDHYAVVLRFRDKFSTSTFSSITTQYDRL